MASALAEDPIHREAEVLVRREGRVGRIELNRPEVINALNPAMIRAISAALTDWEQDPGVSAVAITGAGERGLCAGGDIVAVRRVAIAGRLGEAEGFWREEYLLNAQIARYPKPYVAVMDGIVMGGGVGVSSHGSVRLVTERSRVAMPETGIGFVPDVGGTYLLGRAPGLLGTHLALTAGSIGAGDALLCGLADHFMPSSRIRALLADLATADVHSAVAQHVATAPPAPLAEQREWIDYCYDSDSAEEIVARLQASGRPEAKAAADRILGNSPTAVKTTLATMRRVPGLGSLEAVIDQEFRVSCASLRNPDFLEGVRAQVVDKDRRPRWSPPTLDAVTAESVERHFAPLGDRELGLAAAVTDERH